MVEIFLEKRVVGRDAGHRKFARDAQPGVMGGKRRLYMYEVEWLFAQSCGQCAQCIAAHQTVFRIHWNIACGDADDAVFAGDCLLRIVGGDHHDFVSECLQFAPESADRRRYAVHARKVDVGNIEYAQTPAIDNGTRYCA